MIANFDLAEAHQQIESKKSKRPKKVTAFQDLTQDEIKFAVVVMQKWIRMVLQRRRYKKIMSEFVLVAQFPMRYEIAPMKSAEIVV